MPSRDRQKRTLGKEVSGRGGGVVGSTNAGTDPWSRVARALSAPPRWRSRAAHRVAYVVVAVRQKNTPAMGTACSATPAAGLP
jgi:hypothetical protein